MTTDTSLCAKPVRSAREILREGTHAAHVRLNHNHLLRGITQPGYTLQSYQQVLQVYAVFYRDFEAAVDAFVQDQPPLFDYASRRKLPWLRQDLQHFGLAQPAQAPQAPAALQFASSAQLVALYTIEGSTLGGQLISRHIGTQLGLSADQGGRFFHGYGEATRPRWLHFETFMEQILVDDSGRSAACQKASQVFLHLETALNDYPSDPDQSC